MEKKLIYIIIGMLVLSNVVATTAFSQDTSETLEVATASSEATHTALGEYGTSTTCGYCKYAHGGLKELYAEGNYDFYYVSLVCNKNSKAYDRGKLDFNLYGYPTVWWDGGYRVNVGAGSIPSAKSYYKNSINYCGAREVKDIDIDLSVSWLGGTEIEVEVLLNNNEDATYNGFLRVYITEIESSMNWRDTAGHLYTFPFLDWAFNEEIEITAGGSWDDTTSWIGSQNGYSGVTEDNLMVIAAVFNDEAHLAYSYPPSSNPFDAYYADEVVGVRVGNNRAPEQINIDGPESGKCEEPYNYTFSAEDPDWFDEVYYYIDWGDGDIEDWIGPYSSGEEVTLSHIWGEENTFVITAKAKDDSGEEGPEATLEVTMPKGKSYPMRFTILNWFFEKFPNTFPLLKYFLITHGFLDGNDKEGTGNLVMQLTDAPGLNITEALVNISQVRVHYAGMCQNDTNGTWMNISDDPQTFDLIQLQNATEVLGEANLSVGWYTQIRMYVDKALVTIDGVQYDLKIPSKNVKLVSPFLIQGNETLMLTLDFDVQKSVHKTGSNKYVMKPTIKVIQE